MNLFNYVCPGCGTLYQDVFVNGLTKLRHSKLNSVKDKSKLPTALCVPYHDYVVFDPCGHCCPEVFANCRACQLEYAEAIKPPGQPSQMMCPCHYCQPETTNFKVLEEAMVNERTIIIGEQEFSLDNSGGPGELNTEKNISNTETNTFSIEENFETSRSIGGELAVLKAEIGTKVSGAVKTSIDKTNTIDHKIQFKVPPKEKVTYKVIWKRKERTGIYNISANSDDRKVIYEIPYKMIYDLSYDIKTIYSPNEG